MEYIVVSTSKCKYQEWQIRLLHWSLKKTNQEGKLILLLSDDINHAGENTDFNFDSSIEIHELPDWAKEWEVKEGEWWGGIPNKYEAIKWLTVNRDFKPDDRLLFLDPDMVFLESVQLYPKDNQIIAQEWVGAYPDRKAFMYPFALKFSTLKTFIDTYKEKCIEYRRETKEWISEMYGLDDAASIHNIDIVYREDLGRCTLWNKDSSSNLSTILHFPNAIESIEKEKIFFKQDYTTKLDQKIEAFKSRNFTDSLLLSNIDQERTNYRYYTDFYDKDLFKFYTGEDGYVLYEKWPGGFNNIRMSFELAVCIAFILNRTLVLPPKQRYYLLEGECSIDDFFEIKDLGIEYLEYSEFQKLENIDLDHEKVKEVCKVFDQKTDSVVYNFEKVIPPSKFLKGREYKNITEEIDNKYVYFNRNLLGNFYQILFTKQSEKLKTLIARHVKYKNKIFDIGWLFVNRLEDNSYYSVHVRRNDFQYDDLHIPCQQLYENLKKEVPLGSKLYIATDHDDESFFDLLKENYEVLFFKDVIADYPYLEYDKNWVPIFEQLICTRAIKFIGTDLSTLSSYIYRMRGYMKDIQNKNYYITTKDHNKDSDIYFDSAASVNGGWVREFRNVWEIDTTKVFVSIASYCDGEIFNTLKNLYKYCSNTERITVCVNLQDTEEVYNKLKSFNYSNLNIIFTKKEDALGVVVARNKIKDQVTNEPYFLQIDSHSRFKKDWDLILINQYNSLEEPKVILTCYPNEYHVPDEEEKYLELEYNAPLKIKRFQIPESLVDNRCRATNYDSHKELTPFKAQWCGAGFLFTRSEWLKEVRIPNNIRFTGEEDFQTFISFLKGWNLRTLTEAVVWHNYNYKESVNDEPYREHNNTYLIDDSSVELLNEALFKKGYERSIEELEAYFNITLKKPSTTKTIFIALTSFIDSDLKNTIKSCINQAKNPERLTFGIILQYNNDKETNERCIDDLIDKYNIKIEKYWYEESNGGCWARNLVSKFYSNEDYSLQIDCHTRMAKDWDEHLINEHKSIDSKNIISYLSPGFSHDEDTGLDYSFHNINNRDILNIPTITEITSEYWPKFQGYTNEISTNYNNREVSILYCGFIFGEGKWIIDIKNDPEHYYTGEEFMLSLRAYTKGYNIYQPTKAYSWHRNNPKHIHHHGVFEDHDKRHKHAMVRLKKLIEGEDLGEYGLGNVRTIEEYEKFAKINLKEKRVYT